jgi:hypothetical protein
MDRIEPDYHSDRPIGTGHSNAADVRRLRRALGRIGYGRFPTKAASSVTPGLRDAVVKFQSDFGLERDGVIEPGGPTETALSIALRAKNADGGPAIGEVRDTFAHMSDAGFKFRASQDRRGIGEWVDRDGRALESDQANPALGRSSPQFALMPRKFPFERPGQWILEGGAGGGGGRISRGRIEPKLLWGRTMSAIFGGAPEKETDEGRPAGKPEPMKRTEPHRGPDMTLPPSPSEPPEKRDDKEEFPADERAPTVTVSPIPEEQKPGMTIFPDQSNLVEQWIVLENSRGLKEGQQRDLQYIIDGLYRRLEALGIRRDYKFKHTAGGDTAPTAPGSDRYDPEGNRTYMKERVVKPEGGGMRGSRRPDFSYEAGGYKDDINIVDSLKDNVTPTSRERNAVEGLIANKEAQKEYGATRTLGKSKGMSWEEYTAAADRSLDIIV